MTDRPWLAHYDPGMPRSLAPYPPETLVDLVRRHAIAGAAVALRFEGKSTTFRELYRQANAFARALEERGVRAGDRVALLLPNVPQFVVAELGAWMAGAIVAPMNPTYSDEELAGLLERSGAEVAVALAPFYVKVKAVQPRTRLRHVIVAHVRDALPWWKAILFRLFKEKHEGHGTRPQGDDEAMRDVLRTFRGLRPETEPPRANDAALLLPSGGTTGTPKLVVGTHGGLAISGRQLFAWLGSVIEPDRRTILTPLPLFHVYAAAGIQTFAFHAGACMALVPNPRDTAALLAAVRRDKPIIICAVPGILAAITNHKDLPRTRAALSHVRLCFSGAAPLMAETYRAFEQLTGGIIAEGYSLTEAQMAVVCNPAKGAKRMGTVGMPLPDIDLRLVDIDTGEHDVAPGEPGEVLMAAPQLAKGYWNNPEETARTFTPDETGRVWLHTGDIGHLDAEGYLVLTDRKKELIKVQGFQVWPREIEEVLATHPAVAEVGVAGIPDVLKGERPKAWVVLKPGATATGDELKAFCEGRLASYKVPVQVALVQELPKTAIGKVLRRKLRELDTQGAAVPAMAG